jgi:WD40 repeat protein
VSVAEVFISYAREDQPFVRRLQSALEDRDLSAWVDWEDIPPTAEWMREVEAAIEGSDSLLFVVSPESVASPTCRREIDHAAAQHKRLVPVVYREVDEDLVPEPVQAHNWIFCRESDDFDRALDTIATALRTDLEWVHQHTRLLVRALEWDTNNRDGSFLLRGRDLEDGERWLSVAAQHETPSATPLQIEYLAAGRRGATRSNRVRVGVLSLGLVIAATLAVVALLQRNEARHQATIARARELVASSTAALPDDPELGLWFAVEAERTQSSAGADRNLREGLLESRLEKTFTAPGAPKHPRYTVLGVSPDLRLFVAEGAKRSQPITIRSLETGRTVTTLGVTSESVISAGFSATGSDVVVTVGGATTVWGTRTGKLEGTIDEIGFASQSFDGRRIVIGGTDQTTVYTSEGALVRTLPTGFANAVLNRDGSLAVSWEECTACDAPPVVWDVASGTQKSVLGSFGATAAAFSPVRDEVVTGDKQGVVRVFGLANPAAPLAELHQHTSEVQSVAFSPDGGRVVSGSSDHTARVWEGPNGTSFALRGHTGQVSQAMFNASGTRVATVYLDGTVKIWDTTPFRATPVELPDLAYPSDARLDTRGDRSLNFAFDDTEGHNVVIVRDTRSGRRLLTLEGRRRRFDAAMSGDGRVVVVTTPDGNHAKIWDVASRTARASLNGAGDIFRAPALDADATRAVTAGARTVTIWNARSGARERVLSVPGVTAASFSPDGRVIALVGKHAGSLWDAKTGTLIAHLHGAGDVFRRPQFSPDGTLLATVAGDGSTVQVWNARSGTPGQVGFGPAKGVEGRVVVTVAFSADNRQLLTVYDFGELKVWDVASGTLLIEPPAVVFTRMNAALDAAFSEDRTQVTLLSTNAPLYRYDCPVCASTKSLVARGDQRVSESVKRNALALSLQ